MGAEGELLRRIQAALSRADLESDALVDEAWQAARTEVRAVLQRAFQHELLDRVADAIEGGSAQRARSRPTETTGAPLSSEPERSEPSEPQRSERSGRSERSEPRGGPEATYVFGITRSTADIEDELPRLPGGGPVRAVDHEGLRAVVCDADPEVLRALETLGPDELELLATAANAHDEVLARVAAQAPVLPLRLGTVLGDDATVRALVAANAGSLRAELDRVDGHAEWAVVARVTESARDDAPPATDADSGGEYLRRRQGALAAREERWQTRERLATEVHERLAAFAVAAETIDKRPLEQVPPALHGVYLLAWDQIGPFEDAVDEARVAHPNAIIEATGPWPPYHFTDVNLTLDGERST